MKTTSVFVCSNCDAQTQKWAGRCYECGAWSSLTEMANIASKQDVPVAALANALAVKPLGKAEQSVAKRIPTSHKELDNVLGGGLVQGSLILLGGEPGIGKSTLSIQLAGKIPCLYISGEESIEQIALRAKRLGVNTKDIEAANESNIQVICAAMKEKKPKLVIIDSIQTVYDPAVSGTPGSPAQVRACAGAIMETAKTHNITTVVIGHVTKDGSVAGPKTLEHLVDTVLYLGGDRYHQYRMLRTAKNRFGPTDEVGIFEMKETGLVDVSNPSNIFLEERDTNASGSVLTTVIEGSRAMLIEVQALVNKTSFGYPVRKSSGFDVNRLHVLIAVLEKRAGIDLSTFDVHINVVGGMKLHEPSADLAVCLAITSSCKDKVLGNDLIVFGEVGLSGEIRSVSDTEKRLKSSAHMGIKKAIVPAKTKKMPGIDISCIGVKNIAELISKT